VSIEGIGERVKGEGYGIIGVTYEESPGGKRSVQAKRDAGPASKTDRFNCWSLRRPSPCGRNSHSRGRSSSVPCA